MSRSQARSRHPGWESAGGAWTTPRAPSWCPVSELYTESGDGDETYPLCDDTVDLEVLAHDALLLELPPAPLCRPTATGLCPTCGIDRNLETCQCEEPTDSRFARSTCCARPTQKQVTLSLSASALRRE